MIVRLQADISNMVILVAPGLYLTVTGNVDRPNFPSIHMVIAPPYVLEIWNSWPINSWIL